MKATKAYSAQNQCVRKAAIQKMVSAPSLTSASVRPDGREKTAQNVSLGQAAQMADVQSHMSAIVRRVLGGNCVTNQIVARDAIKQMDIVPSQGSASARSVSKESVVTYAYLIQDA